MTIEEIRSFFSHDKYATETTGIDIIEATPGYAKVSLKVGREHKNAHGTVMGAVYFTMGDFAFAIASNNDIEDTIAVSINSNISFLRPAKGDVLYAEARMTKDGKTTCFCHSEVTDNTGRLVAIVTTTGQRVPYKK